MGMTAENVADALQRQPRGAGRVGGDLPDTRAVAAQAAGHFDKEIVPVTVPAHKDVDKEGNEIDVPETVVTKDDGPRAGTTLEKLAALKPVFKEGGTRDGRQRLPAERRRRGAARDVRGEGAASWA